MNTTILTQIEKCLITLQQECGFKAYAKAGADGFRTPSVDDFQTFYFFGATKNVFLMILTTPLSIQRNALIGLNCYRLN